MINRNYFSLCFENAHEYRIVETIKKPKKKNCALATLEKIELAIKGKFQNMKGWGDDYSKKTPTEMFAILKNKAQDITNKYCAKIDKSNWLFRLIFGQKYKSKIKDLNQRIQALANPFIAQNHNNPAGT